MTSQKPSKKIEPTLKVKIHYYLSELFKSVFLTRFKNQTKPQKKVIYTALFNGYDDLIEPLYVTPDWDYICFTDDPSLKSDVWQCICIDTNTDLLKENPALLNRKLKILYFEHLSDYDLSIYADANILIKRDLDRFVMGKIKNNKRIALSRHDKRTCTYQEAEACIAQKKDIESKIRAQMSAYREQGFPEDAGLAMNRLIIRKHTDDTKALMQTWWDELNKLSQRDQLSLMYCIWKEGFSNYQLFDYYEFKKYFAVVNHKN